MNKTLIAIAGKSASGKDFAVSKAKEELGIPQLLSYATRELREGEDINPPYKFIDWENVNKIINDNFQLLVDINSKNLYFSTYTDLENMFFKHDVCTLIITPDSVPFVARKLKNINIKIIFIYIDETDENRKKNMIKRGDTEEMINNRLNNLDKDIDKMFNDYISISGDNGESFYHLSDSDSAIEAIKNLI